MILKYLNWIWHIRGTLALPEGQSPTEAIDRLTPMFEMDGTTYERTDKALTFQKKDQAAQDKMSIFDSGTLTVSTTDGSPELKFDLKSRALLTCFLAPLVFLAFAQFSILLSGLHAASDGADRATERTAETTEDEEDKKVRRLHPIDQILGAPEPKQPDEDKDKADCTEQVEGREGEACDAAEEAKKLKHSPTTAYVFAGIFFVVFLVGRVLEDWLIRRAFRRRLEAKPEDASLDELSAEG